ncbi:MAG: D-cysteine desulfhydrase family protein [Planctomycetes bacterium]|nr:D-cysteine desulfhydrase family protein [Planctomycetota bacterium]
MNTPPRIALANLPTPLVRCTRLEAALGVKNAIWIKRDDLTGVEFSGNKIRKLEYIAAAMKAAGQNALVTEGTCQSNHCRATAAVCARLGFAARLLFRPMSNATPQGNELLDSLFGAETAFFSRQELSENKAAILEEQFAQLRKQGRNPRYTPPGASEPLGCWGYIRAAQELAEQINQLKIGPCDVLIAVSSGGTYAGLLLGSLMMRACPWRLWGVPVSDDVAYHVREVGRLCRETISGFDMRIDFRDEAMQFVDGFIGAGYAIPYPAAIRAIRLLARTEAMVLDPVYTAKAFCALLDGVAQKRWASDRPVVFIHTGGIFSDFAWPELLQSPAGETDGSWRPS